MTLYSIDGVCRAHLEETINTAREVFLSLVRNKRWGYIPVLLGLSKILLAFKEFQVSPNVSHYCVKLILSLS